MKNLSSNIREQLNYLKVDTPISQCIQNWKSTKSIYQATINRTEFRSIFKMFLEIWKIMIFYFLGYYFLIQLAQYTCI